MHRLLRSAAFRIILAVVVSVGFLWLSFAVILSLESKAISDRRASQDKSIASLLAQNNQKAATFSPSTKNNKASVSPVTSGSKTVQDCQKVTNTEPDMPAISADKPGLSENTSYNYYLVYGWSPTDIYAQTQKCGPDTPEGIFEGSTDYRLRWSYKYMWDSAENCKISSVAVGANIKINLPKWERPEGVDQSTVDYWETSSTNLKNHENVHRQITVDAAGKILKSLQDLPEQDCHQIEQSAENMAMSIFDQIQIDQNNFDSETNHGANQT